MFVSYQQLTTMKISGVEYHIDFISNNSLQFTSNVITKCVGWIYYKMLHPILHKAHVIIILWLSSVVNGRSRSNEPFSQFVVSNGKKFPFVYSFSSIKHSMVALSSIAFAMKSLSSSSSLGYGT